MTVVFEMPYPAAMAAKNEANDPAADRRRSPARARMVRSAATLIRERGVHGTGLRQVVAHSGGPRGSLGRVDHDFALGCPLAATICDAAGNDSLRSHVSELLARWRAPVVDSYTRFGAPQAEAEAHATVLMAALEGALMLARAQRSIEPLDTVERFFASTSSRSHAGRTSGRRVRRRRRRN
jgi:AcrR family transcriptional regulator